MHHLWWSITRGDASSSCTYKSCCVGDALNTEGEVAKQSSLNLRFVPRAPFLLLRSTSTGKNGGTNILALASTCPKGMAIKYKCKAVQISYKSLVPSLRASTKRLGLQLHLFGMGWRISLKADRSRLCPDTKLCFVLGSLALTLPLLRKGKGNWGQEGISIQINANGRKFAY